MLSYRQGTDYLDDEVAVLVLAVRAVRQIRVLIVQGQAYVIVAVSFLEDILYDS